MQIVSFWRQFAWNIKVYFLRKSDINLLSADLAQRLVKVKYCTFYYSQTEKRAFLVKVERQLHIQKVLFCMALYSEK